MPSVMDESEGCLPSQSRALLQCYIATGATNNNQRDKLTFLRQTSSCETLHFSQVGGKNVRNTIISDAISRAPSQEKENTGTLSRNMDKATHFFVSWFLLAR